MTLESNQELRATHESIVRLYTLRDSLLVEKTGDPELRRLEAEGVEVMIHKLERQLAEYIIHRESTQPRPKAA